jgi:hypothetical protein
MAKTVCKILGVVFVLVGLIGFAKPDLLGAHLTGAHNAVHIISGAIALYLGFAGSLSAAKTFCLVFGVVYLALGILGMTLGEGADRFRLAERACLRALNGLLRRRGAASAEPVAIATIRHHE